MFECAVLRRACPGEDSEASTPAGLPVYQAAKHMMNLLQPGRSRFEVVMNYEQGPRVHRQVLDPTYPEQPSDMLVQ